MSDLFGTKSLKFVNTSFNNVDNWYTHTLPLGENDNKFLETDSYAEHPHH